MNTKNIEKLHYIGHRERLRKKFISHRSSLYDYELIEMLLFYVFRRQDTKKPAKSLLKKFKTLRALFSADPSESEKIPGIKNLYVLRYSGP